MEHHHHQSETIPAGQRCEVCVMLAEIAWTDDHGVQHYACAHHVPQIKNQSLSRGEHPHHPKSDRHEEHSVNMFREKFWLSLVLSVPVVLYSTTIQDLLNFTLPVFPGSQWIPFVFGTSIFFSGGLVFLKSALRELKAKLPGMMTLIALAITAAYVYSLAVTFGLEGTEFFWELATLITIMLLGHWLEMKSVSAASGALQELAKLLPDEAERIVRSSEVRSQKSDIERVSVAELGVGDLVLVRPGAKVPADGKIIEGQSSVNESMLSGESKPIGKGVGDPVIAGTINGQGALTVQVTKVGADTALAGIMRLVAEAQASRSRTQILADRAAQWLTGIAILVGGGSFIGWLGAGAGLAFATERLVTVLVIACPHALGLAVPLVTAISTSLSARNGILVRQRMALESARAIDVVLFDKTGTLTTGTFGIDRVWTASNTTEEELLVLAAAVEAASEHPIARAIVDRAGKIRTKAKDVQAIAGRGIQGTVNNKTITIGGPQFLTEHSIEVPPELKTAMERAEKEGKTVVTVIRERTPLGIIALADQIRAESKEAIAALRSVGIRVAMVTGDAKDVAQTVAKQLGIQEVFARILPEHKVEKVKSLQGDGSRVMMVGDGVNDAPALTQADVGVAIGAGTDVAIESAGIILVKNDPRDISRIVTLSRATYSKMVQNLLWATGYNVIAIPLAAGVLASQGILLAPALGAVLMSLSTVVVALNAQLLRRTNLDMYPPSRIPLY